MKYKNAVIITGPTTTGKTDISIELAKRLDGEIINSDRLFVYSFLKIGSGLSDCLEQQDITRHLYGICTPNEILTTKQYVQRVEQTVPQILMRDKLPIIEGCSSIYNPALITANNIPERTFYYKPAIAIVWPKGTNLQTQIEKRLNKMFEAGLLEEAETVFKNGQQNTHPVQISAVYNPLMKYFEGHINLEQAKKEIIKRGITFAKLQRRTFEKIDGITPIEHDRKNINATVDKIVELIRESQTA